MGFRVFLSLVLLIVVLSGCNTESSVATSEKEVATAEEKEDSYEIGDEPVVADDTFEKEVVTAKEAKNLLNEIGDAPAFTDDTFENKEEVLNRLIELQDWTIRVITFNGNYYQQKDNEAIDLVASKLQGTYSIDITNYYINKYYKKEENGLWTYLEQEGIGLLGIIDKNLNIEIIKENDVVHVNITGITDDYIEIRSNYSFRKKDGQYQIIEVSNTTN